MKYKRIIFILFLLSLIGLICLNAISQELPFLMDFAQLKLEVTNTEVVDQISCVFCTDTITFSAKEGDKIVVVTLKGIVPHPCRITIEPRDFSVIYEEETTNSKGEKEVSLGFRVSDATSVTGESWGWLLTRSTFTGKPGPIILKMAVCLPEQITDFFVRYPVLAKGKTTISAQASE